jgi:uncharacterized protein involved in exopolysaccharide biosynthesis
MNAALEFIVEQLRGVWRFRWTAMLVAWVVCLLGWLIVLVMPDTYSAWARVFVDTRTRLNQVTQGIGVDSNLASEVEAVRQALLGAQQVEKVARAAIPSYADVAASKERSSMAARATHRRANGEGTGPRPYVITYTDHDPHTTCRGRGTCGCSWPTRWGARP